MTQPNRQEATRVTQTIKTKTSVSSNLEHPPSYRREDFLRDLARATRKTDRERSDPRGSRKEA